MFFFTVKPLEPFIIPKVKSEVIIHNSSVNNDPTELRWPRTVSLILYSLAFVLGVLGNGVVIWVTGIKMKKTVNSVWFLSLAVADFVFTAFLPLSLTEAAMNFHWPFGNFMCKMHVTIFILNMSASIYMLMVISVDRCVSVVKPVWAQNHRNVCKAFCVSLCVWALSLILSSPYFVFSGTDSSDNDSIHCNINFNRSDKNHRQNMTITYVFLDFVIPFTVIVSCYAVIIHRLRRNRTLANKSSRSFKIIAAIIIVFFLCFAPMQIMNLFYLVNQTADYTRETLNYFYSISLSLVCLNSCINPLLYVFMSPDFKDVVRKSILKVLENAFQEEEPRSYTNPEVTVQTNKSSDTEV
ncbi:C3a anaphylatoxin chemotactic receptor-like [Kryptolebias marmoratus]|uniref:C3a anaphylatoxin chemotactic receptor-like n=1 Tax=Kryptolebias marmoratus TaxID=37003 RepID=UPI0018ACD4B6|nr:C3a anaphylatoxin chemotactic receptor-like [Kryptolebias marmoratus]